MKSTTLGLPADFNGAVAFKVRTTTFSDQKEDVVLTIRHYRNGLLHRENGPAIQAKTPSGRDEWWVEGTKLTEQEFNQWLDKKNLNEKLQAALPHRPITRRGKI